jgi:CRISPR-associated protein Cpf1
LENFDDFGFDGEDYYFTYTDKNTEKKWTLFSGKNGKSLGRFYRELKFENSEKQWTPKEQNLAERLDKIFKNFDFKRENSAKKQILEGDEIKLEKYRQEDQNPWESLRFTIDLIQQIRNTGKEGKDDDFIFSPVRDGDGQNGEHFDSRKAGKDMPNSGDANGAYNIARKGLIMYEHIKMDIKKLYISDEEWDAWLAGKDIWEKWLLENRKKLK